MDPTPPSDVRRPRPRTLAPLNPSDRRSEQRGVPLTPPVTEEMQLMQQQALEADAQLQMRAQAAIATNRLPKKMKIKASPRSVAPAPPDAPPSPTVGKSSPRSSPPTSARRYMIKSQSIDVSPSSSTQQQGSNGYLLAATAPPSDGPKMGDARITIHPDLIAATQAATMASNDVTDSPIAAVSDDYIISFYPRMKDSAHLENYFLLEVVLQLLCGLCQVKRDRQKLLLTMSRVVSYMSPILGALWCASMVLSMLFFIDSLPNKYLYCLIFSGVYPTIRFGFASVPLLRLLLTSFETWFLIAQVILMIASFGALNEWGLKFWFTTVCLSPGLLQTILLDANMTSIVYSTFTMLFGAAYTLAFAIFLSTGKIVDKDVTLSLSTYNISLIDFTNTRLITLMIFLLKNIVMLWMNPTSYIQIRSRVFKSKPPTRMSNRLSIA